MKLILHLWGRDRRRARKGCQGQTLVEYALILAMISIVAVLVLAQIGTKISSVYLKNESSLDQAISYNGSN